MVDIYNEVKGICECKSRWGRLGRSNLSSKTQDDHQVLTSTFLDRNDSSNISGYGVVPRKIAFNAESSPRISNVVKKGDCDTLAASKGTVEYGQNLASNVSIVTPSQFAREPNMDAGPVYISKLNTRSTKNISTEDFLVPLTLYPGIPNDQRPREEDPAIMPIPRRLGFQFDSQQLRGIDIIRQGGNGCAKRGEEFDIEEDYDLGGGGTMGLPFSSKYSSESTTRTSLVNASDIGWPIELLQMTL